MRKRTSTSDNGNESSYRKLTRTRHGQHSISSDEIFDNDKSITTSPTSDKVLSNDNGSHGLDESVDSHCNRSLSPDQVKVVNKMKPIERSWSPIFDCNFLKQIESLSIQQNRESNKLEMETSFLAASVSLLEKIKLSFHWSINSFLLDLKKYRMLKLFKIKLNNSNEKLKV